MDRSSFMLILAIMLPNLIAAEPDSGDFAKFFITEVKARTGQSLNSNSIPELKGRWRIDRDDYGFQIWISALPFSTVDEFLTKVLGKPQAPAVLNLDGKLQSGYYRNPSRLHIQLIDGPREIHLIAVGPKKSQPKEKQ
jgi:hypothetical protein